jgi:formylglycine-generating enzyme required for sulfatase activity
MRHAANILGLLACLLLMGPAPLCVQLRPETSQPPEKKAETEQPARAAPPETQPLRPSAQALPSSGQARVAVALAAPTAGAVRQNSKDGLNYVWIPPGTFTMGCSPGDSECYLDEDPAHGVTIRTGFWIGQTVVTVGAYKRFTAGTRQRMPHAPNFNSGWTSDNMPIVSASWDDSEAYCQWAGGRLPTEAEWEYAARGGSTEARYGPLDEVAWYSGNSGGGTHDVAQKRANAFGVYDTLGNVWEWVNDLYDAKYYHNSPSQDPRGPRRGSSRVLRGGSWGYDPGFVRVSYRLYLDPSYKFNVIGLRCVGEANIP